MCRLASPPPPPWTRTGGSQGLKRPPEPTDHRRVGLRRTIPHLRGTALRGLQPALRAGLHHGDHQSALRRSTNGLAPCWTGEADRSPVGAAHPPRPHPGDERRELPPQVQQGNRRVPSSRRSRGRIGRTVNAVSTRSFNVPTPTNLLASIITSVVHEHAAAVDQYLGVIDISAGRGIVEAWEARGPAR